jgi:hypothetical protein
MHAKQVLCHRVPPPQPRMNFVKRVYLNGHLKTVRQRATTPGKAVLSNGSRKCRDHGAGMCFVFVLH